MSSTYRDFDKADFNHLYLAFINSFSDYFITFSPTEEQFNNRIFHKLNIAPDLSALAWQDERVIGFILHTINDYEGIRTIYNGGTGTVLSARRTGTATRLYEYLLPKLTATGAQRILLEVIDKNKHAQRLYESLGFRFNRVLKCFVLNQQLTCKAPSGLEIQRGDIMKSVFSEFMSFEPSFMDSTNQLKFNLHNEWILEATLENEPIGYLIFQPNTGRITQLAIHPTHRNKGVGKALINECQRKSASHQVSIMNIPEGEVGTIEALESIGFQNELDQFELELII